MDFTRAAVSVTQSIGYAITYDNDGIVYLGRRRPRRAEFISTLPTKFGPIIPPDKRGGRGNYIDSECRLFPEGPGNKYFS